MSFDAFLKIDGIKGESQDLKHGGEIELLSFSMAVSQTNGGGYNGMMHGGGLGAGKVQYSDLTLLKRVDSSSPMLMVHCSCGTHFKEANLVVRKAGDMQTALEYMKIKFTDVIISSYKPRGNSQQHEFQMVHALGNDFDIKDNSQTPGVMKMYGDELPLETFSIGFSRIEFAYQPQGPDGNARGGPIMGGWDLKQNKKI